MWRYIDSFDGTWRYLHHSVGSVRWGRRLYATGGVLKCRMEQKTECTNLTSLACLAQQMWPKSRIGKRYNTYKFFLILQINWQWLLTAWLIVQYWNVLTHKLVVQQIRRQFLSIENAGNLHSFDSIHRVSKKFPPPPPPRVNVSSTVAIKTAVDYRDVRGVAYSDGKTGES